jgi:hypothetical protein
MWIGLILVFKISYPFDFGYSNESLSGLSQPASATTFIEVDWIDFI